MPVIQTASVSAIIPVWRCASTAEAAIASAFAQSRRPLEVIVVDDASGDGTADRLRNLIPSYPKGWLTVMELNENGGPGIARNAGWEAARGDYVAFLDADDHWHPEKIEVQYGWMVASPDVMLTGGSVARVDTWSKKLDRASHSFRRVGTRRQLLRNNFATSTVMIRRDVPQRFARDKRRSEDYLLWTTIMLEGGVACDTELMLARTSKAAFGDGGLSGDLRAMFNGQLESYRMLAEQGLISAPVCVASKSFAWFRYLIRRARLRVRDSIHS